MGTAAATTDARQQFSAAYRAVRQIRHRIAGAQAVKRLGDNPQIRNALAAWTSRHNGGCFGVEYARRARRDGYSFRYAIRLHLRAVRHRRGRA